MNKIEHEGMRICARIDKSQDADNTDQKVKWFLKVHRNIQTFVGSIFLILFFPKFLFTFTCYKFFDFQPPPPPPRKKMRVKHKN